MDNILIVCDIENYSEKVNKKAKEGYKVVAITSIYSNTIGITYSVAMVK